MIGDKRYFVLHAPRQTGKTSTLLALRDLLNSGGVGEFRCVYVNVEAAQAVREDVRRAMQVILGELASRARSAGDEFLYDAWPDILETFGDGALAEALTRWCENTAAPVVLLIDEIDTLIGDTLIAVLRQLRARYDRRPESFPQSVVLCGVRDVRDYRIHSNLERMVIAGGSAFNVKARSLRLGDFSRDEVSDLLAQHTQETGQAFSPR
ncbi:MAG: ATP-binding protein, partial [Chloroflexi bacterium]|nr:ATP-binding protein [Chloroflexota bacterium]